MPFIVTYIVSQVVAQRSSFRKLYFDPQIIFFVAFELSLFCHTAVRSVITSHNVKCDAIKTIS